MGVHECVCVCVCLSEYEFVLNEKRGRNEREPSSFLRLGHSDFDRV